MNKERVTPAVWVYEIAMGGVQALIGLVLILAGNQLVYFFGGGYGLLGGGRRDWPHYFYADRFRARRRGQFPSPETAALTSGL